MALPYDPSCDLCEAAHLSEWHHEDDICWVADCEVCGVPMVVWKRHGPTPPESEVEHMVSQLTLVANARFGEGAWSVDRVVPPARPALTPPPPSRDHHVPHPLSPT